MIVKVYQASKVFQMKEELQTALKKFQITKEGPCTRQDK